MPLKAAVDPWGNFGRRSKIEPALFGPGPSPRLIPVQTDSLGRIVIPGNTPAGTVVRVLPGDDENPPRNVVWVPEGGRFGFPADGLSDLHDVKNIGACTVYIYAYDRSGKRSWGEILLPEGTGNRAASSDVAAFEVVAHERCIGALLMMPVPTR